MQYYISSCTSELGDLHRKIQRLHLFTNVEAMVKEKKASHIVNLNLSGWNTLMPSYPYWVSCYAIIGLFCC